MATMTRKGVKFEFIVSGKERFRDGYTHPFNSWVVSKDAKNAVIQAKRRKGSWISKRTVEFVKKLKRVM